MRAHKNKLDFCSNKRHFIVTLLSTYCNCLIKSILLYILFAYHSIPKYQIIYIYIYLPETIEYTSTCVPKCKCLQTKMSMNRFAIYSILKAFFPQLSFFGSSIIWKLCHILTIAREMGIIFAIEAISSY